MGRIFLRIPGGDGFAMHVFLQRQAVLCLLITTGVLNAEAVGLPAIVSPPVRHGIQAQQVVVRTGETLSLEVASPQAHGASSRVVWQRTRGSLQADGNTARFTAPESPGYAVIRADVVENDVVRATYQYPVLVYEQFVLLKADDYVGWTGDISPEWRTYVDYLTHERRLKHSVGIITLSMDGFTPPNAFAFTEDIKAMAASGLVEFWHHGLTHEGAPTDDPPLTEFYGMPLSFQQSHLVDGRQMALETAGLSLTTFGPPFGLTDATTLTAVGNVPEINVWYSGQPAFSGTVLEVDGNAIEETTGLPDYELFEAVYDEDDPYLVLQVHPGFIDVNNAPLFIDNFGEFEAVVDFLLDRGAQFILPREYHALVTEGHFPLHPDADQDGDGVNDFAEGQGDADLDGLPDFLDADTNGLSGPGVQDLRLTDAGAGVVELAYELDSAAPAQVSGWVSLDGGLTFDVAMTGASGDIGVAVSPGAGKQISWNTTGVIPEGFSEPVFLRLVPELPTTGTLAPATIAGGTFTQGCADCSTGTAIPTHTVSLNAYEMAPFETTNGDFVDVLNYALAQGYLEDMVGQPYMGGDVYLSRERLYRTTDPEAEISFDGTSFAVGTRDGLALDEFPVVHVSWYGAVAYCVWQSEREGLAPAYALDGSWTLRVPVREGYRLPTEAEWERAAAWQPPPGAIHFRYGFSSDVINPGYANYGTFNPGGYASGLKTTPIGYFDGKPSTFDAASPTGLYDMSGNVAEWCHDRQRTYTAEAVGNPLGGDTTGARVVRGGSWQDDASACRTDIRATAFANTTNARIGFRVARTRYAGAAQARVPVDTVPPELDAFALMAAPAPTDQTVTVQVIFSEMVEGIGTEDFTVSTSGEVDVAPTVTAIAGGPIAWSVTIDVGSMSGTLGLAVANDATVTDMKGNALSGAPTSGALHTVETLSPLVRSVTLVGTPPLNGRTLTFDVAFSKEVTEVTLSDFEALSSGDVVSPPAVTGVFGSGAVRQVTVKVNQVEGAVGLALSESNQIVDLDARPLENTLGSGLIHTADTVGQRISGIVLLNNPPLTASTVTFGITFTGDVSGFTMDHVQVGIEGREEGLPSVTALRGSDAMWEADVAVGALEGVLRITVQDNAGEIVDDLGNVFVPTGTISPPHNADTLSPDLLSIAVDGSPPLNAPSFSYVLTFSEAVTGLSLDNVFLSSDGTGVPAPRLTGVSVVADPAQWVVVVDTGAFEGLAGLTVPDGLLDVEDGVGNPLDRGVSTGLNRPVDTIAPVLEQVTLATASPTGASTVLYEASFSEPVAGFAGSGEGYLDITATGLTYETVSVTPQTSSRYTIAVSGLAGDGELGLTLATEVRETGSIADTAGNALAPVTVDPVVARVDRVGPTMVCRDISVTVGPGGRVSILPEDLDDGSFDPTGILERSLSGDVFTCADVGSVVPVILTAVDGLGNEAICVSNVTVTDAHFICTGEGEGVPEVHTADWNGVPDFRIDLTELLRGIQLFQFGVDGYCCDEGEGERLEDGYVSGPCGEQMCPPHALDYAPLDRRIDMGELLRLIQFYNSGGYYRCETESGDGFCVGVAEEGEGAAAEGAASAATERGRP